MKQMNCRSLVCLLLIAPLLAHALMSGPYTYTVSDGKATITNFDTYDFGSLSIASNLGGYPVTTIGDLAFAYCSSLTSVTIPSSVTSIGGSAFSYCSGLTSVTIPSSVTSIGGSAFSYCVSLTSITISSGVTTIGKGAFSYCSSLTSVTIPSNVTSIGQFAFFGCDSLASVTIPSSVTSIGVSAFSYCYSLTSVTIPSSVTSIDGSAFSYCSSLTSVTIPSSVTSIGMCAFSYCSSLISVNIGSSVTTIGECAFEACSRLTSVLFYGDAPTLVCSEWCDIFRGSWPTVYRLAGASGWGETFSGRPVEIWNRKPITPTLISPGNGAMGVSLTSTLEALGFIDPVNGASHANSQWQVDGNSSFQSPEWNSGENSVASTLATVPAGRLSFNTTYYWRARYKNSLGLWSEWSSSRSFTTCETCTLGDAVDTPNLTWTTGGDANWFQQWATTHDGGDAAQSGSITYNQQSWMQTTVAGPGAVSFWWKVSSRPDYDFLRFYVDGVQQMVPISGEAAWQQVSHSIASGNHNLKWVYTKGVPGGAVGTDCGWIDGIRWEPGFISPVYRFWSPKFRGHFYTISESEKNNIIVNLPQDWSHEGIAYYAYGAAVPGTVPVYRFWSAKYRGHFYTISESEKNNIIANLSNDWAFEGIAYYAYSTAVPGSMPVYRFWSPRYRRHFYTISEAEKNNVIANLSQDWNYEGIAFYAFTSANADALDGVSIPATAEDLTGKTVMSAEPSSFALESAIAASESEADDSGSASIQSATTSDYGDVVFPLSYPGRDVAAYVYDSLADKWTCVLETTNSPSSATLRGILPDRSYLLEVFAGDPTDGEMLSVHRSWFEMQLDAPTQLNGSFPPVIAEDGVGSPVARIHAPAGDGTLTLKLYSSSQGVVQTLTEVLGGETLELSLPERNRWYWIGGWRDADNALVLSLWLRHETEE